MCERVAFEREALRKPGLESRVLGIDLVGHDAHGCAAVDLLEPVQDGPQERLVPGRVAHVVDGQHDHGFDPRLADPAGRDQPGRIALRLVGVEFIDGGDLVSAWLGLIGGGPRCDPDREARRRGEQYEAERHGRFPW